MFPCPAQTVEEQRVIFIIDGAQFIDVTSWVFMEYLVDKVPLFIIMSLSPFTQLPCEAARAIIKKTATTYISLGPLQPKDIHKKVCLDLNVYGIPKELNL